MTAAFWRGAVVALLLLSGKLAGCAWPSEISHRNFKTIMAGNVGRSLDDLYIYRNRNWNFFVTTTHLTNGNVEEEFRAGRGPTCRVFFEIDDKAKKIVGWRYTGTQEDCSIVP